MKASARLRLACSLAVLTLAHSQPGQAQAPGDQLLEEVIVTGSMIRGLSENAAMPVDVIDGEELQRLGSPTAVELIKSLPTSSGVIGDTNQFDSRSQATEGMASINLRGLSPQRTLVLLNSKRLVQAGTGVPFVDVNLLPLSAIRRVEILKDGASATYGSDAISGVVNFITRSDQEGFQVSGDYKGLEDSDGDYNVAGSYGFQGDKLRVFVAADYQHRSELLAKDRDFAVSDYLTNPEGGWTGGGNPATFLTLGLIPGPNGVSVGPNSALLGDPDCETLGGFRSAEGRCRTQYTPFDALIEEEDRYRAYGELGIDLGKDTTLDFSALWGQTENPHYRSSPSYLLTRSPSAVVGGSSSGFIVPASNPGYQQLLQDHPDRVPAGSVAALFPTLLFRPFLTGGNPAFEGDPDGLGASTGHRESETLRLTADLSGRINDTLEYQAAVTWQEYRRYYDGYDSFGDRVQLALAGYGGPNCDPSAGTPGANGCSWLNPFGNALTGTGPDNNNREMIDWFFVPASTEVTTDLFVADLNLSGSTGLSLGGGEVLFGVGLQYRDNGFEAEYGDNNNLAVTPCLDTPVTGNTSCDPALGALAFLGTNQDADLESDVWAAFVEVFLPFTDDFNLQAAARYEDYGGATGSTFDPKLTARWQVNDTFALRSSIGTTFRGPPAQQLTDRSVTSLQVIANSFRPVDVFGSPDLEPESALNFSAGLMFEAGGFSGSVDYFRYELEDTITAEPLSGMVGTLFDDPARCDDPAYQALRQRFQFQDGNGVAGAGTCAVSNISRVETRWVNGGDQTSAGLDFMFNWENDDFAGGRLGSGLTATYVMDYEVGAEVVEGVKVQDSFDAVGSLNFQTTSYPVPEWKTKGFVEWGRPLFGADTNARLTLNYIDSYRDQRADKNEGPFAPRTDLPGNPVLDQGAKIDSYTTLDFSLLVSLPSDINLSFSVFNLTDRDPSFARLDYNYDPFTGSPAGRQFKLGITSRF
ncbi:TonB-dependent receptor domain-containing protein [Parahaliea aestuarii]|nr:TonB-dependent receptor [Parahaliea aestuarii]